jgi:hypothetical protein
MAVAQKIGAKQYLECSARTGEGVREVFQYATRAALLSQQGQQEEVELRPFVNGLLHPFSLALDAMIAESVTGKVPGRQCVLGVHLPFFFLLDPSSRAWSVARLCCNFVYVFG